MGCGCKKTSCGKNCQEDNTSCFSKLARSISVRITFCVSELLANIFCAIRDVSYSIRCLQEFFQDYFDSIVTCKEYAYEIFSFVENVTLEKRPVCKLPFTGVLKSIKLYTFEKGEGQLTFNLYVNGSIVLTNIATSLEQLEIPLNIQVSKFDLVELEIVGSDDYVPWTGLACYLSICEE